MKKIMLFVACSSLLLSSCDTYTGSGAYAGATFGSILGSAIGGLSGGPRGSDTGIHCRNHLRSDSGPAFSPPSATAPPAGRSSSPLR